MLFWIVNLNMQVINRKPNLFFNGAEIEDWKFTTVGG